MLCDAGLRPDVHVQIGVSLQKAHPPAVGCTVSSTASREDGRQPHRSRNQRGWKENPPPMQAWKGVAQALNDGMAGALTGRYAEQPLTENHCRGFRVREGGGVVMSLTPLGGTGMRLQVIREVPADHPHLRHGADRGHRSFRGSVVCPSLPSEKQ